MATSGKLTIDKRRLIAAPALVLFGDMRFKFDLCELELCGLGLADVPPEFGWSLELLILEQSGVKSAAGPSEVQTKVVDVIDVDDDSSLSEADSDDVHITRCEIMLAETRSEPVMDFNEPQPEPSPGFEERLDDFAEKVADIDVNLGEGPETLVENVETTPMQPPSKQTVLRGRFLQTGPQTGPC